VLVLNDCSDQDNLGTDALMDGLHMILLGSVPTATFRSIPSHWVMDASVLGTAFRDGGKRLAQPTPVFPDVADQFEEIAGEWLQGRAGPAAMEFLAKFDGVDLVVLNGEGSIYRTNQSAVRELFLVWLAKTHLGIPTIFVNGTIHLTDVVPILPAMVRKALGVLDAVAVREPFSLRNLHAYASDIPARLIPDTAFVRQADTARSGDAVRAVHERLQGRDYFCYDPGPMAMDGRTPYHSAQYALISGLKEIVSEAVLVSTPPVLPHVAALPRLAEETDSIYAGTLRDYREFMALIRDARFVVSGRYHDTIFAAIMGCPTIALASASHKVHGICELLDGLVGMPFDGTDLRSDLDAIKEQAAHYVSVADTLGPDLRAKAQQLGAAAWETGELVKAALALEVRQI
jgi:hypothetical protein